LSRATRKYDEFDLLKLYSSGSFRGWNEYLNTCFLNNNINSLASMRYALQAGVDKLARQKLNDDKMSVFYLRLMKSVEDTAKKIIRKTHPLPTDNPLIAKNNLDTLAIKRRRDAELELFFKNSSY
jgi:hypothetical protein